MATWDILEISVNKMAKTVVFERGFSPKSVKAELTNKIIKKIQRILHDKARGYDVNYTDSSMSGFPYFSYVYQNDCSLYK